eukprot:1159619-Pelagomonas_calceolata.AAC.3
MCKGMREESFCFLDFTSQFNLALLTPSVARLMAAVKSKKGYTAVNKMIRTLDISEISHHFSNAPGSILALH